jgi:hypothetical protein
MKSPASRIAFLLFLGQLAFFSAQTARAAVGFTVLPSAISNTYAGPVTLQVTGLKAGEMVVVQKFLDANNNGVIDSGDPLWQQFNLTDGASFVIGGVTNINVPGDTDTVPGQITAKLNLQAEFQQLIVGNYLFKISSPSGSFAPITNSFAVTNFPFAQKFTGSIVNNGTNVPNAAVIVFQSAGGNGLNPVGGAAVNNAGNYTIQMPPGTYAMLAFKNGFLANTGGAADVSLAAGQVVSTNLTLINATETISGQVTDAADSAVGLPGLLLSVQSTNGLLGIGFTDTNGNFTTGAVPNKWKIGGDSAAIAFHGYVALQDKTKVDTTSGSVSGVAIALPKATALFYGTVKDNTGQPLPGEVDVYASDQNVTNNYNGLYQSDGYTDSNGNFVVGVVGSSDANELWYLSIDNASSFPNDDFSQPVFDQNGGTNIAPGSAVPANFTAALFTSFITGQVLFHGSPVANVQVTANSEDAHDYFVQALTDNNGNYSLPVVNDTWFVNINCQGNDNTLDGILGPGNYQCPCGFNVTVLNANVATNFVVQGGGAGEIYGYVADNEGNSIVGVTVSATDCNNDYASAVTDGNGYYSMNVPNGVWDVSVDCGFLNREGYQCVNSASVTVSSGNIEQNFTALANGSSGGALQITTQSLPDGFVGSFYNQQLSASGGAPPYAWAVALGSQSLPSALTLSTNGLLSGLPGTSGTNNFIVSLTDSSLTSVSHTFTLVIDPALKLTSPVKSGNLFQFLVNGLAGQDYTLQTSTNLSSPNWTILFTTNSANNSILFNDATATNTQRFYRVLVGP